MPTPVKDVLFQVTASSVTPIPIVFPTSPIAMTQNANAVNSIPTTSALTVLAANASRKSATIINNSEFAVHFSIGGAATVANGLLPPGGAMNLSPTTIADLELGLVSIYNPNSTTAATVSAYEAV